MNRLERSMYATMVVFGLACGDSGKSDNGRTGEELDFTAFDEAMNAFLAEHGLEGASAAIVHKERGIVHESGYGAFAADRVYLIASSSKVLSAGVLMRLADQGLVDVDAPISEYLSNWGEHKTDISVASLLSNSSGLVSLTENPLYAPYLCQYLDAGSLLSCAQAIYAADDADTRSTPDTKFAYGGAQWQLAGGVAEAVSGKSWAELIQETYVEPCDTPSLGYANHYGRANSTGEALTYPSFFMGDPGNLDPTDNPNIEGGAYIKAADYGKLLLMHLRGGKCGDNEVLSSASVARMQEDRIAKEYNGSTGSAALAGYGFGWWVDRKQEGLFVDPGAYGAVAWIDLARDYGAFLVVESESETGSLLRLEVQPILEELFDKL